MNLGINAQRMLNKLDKEERVTVSYGIWFGPSGCGEPRRYGQWQFQAAKKLCQLGLATVASQQTNGNEYELVLIKRKD